MQLLVLFIVSFDIIKRSVHVTCSDKGDEVILLLKLSDDVLESIELFNMVDATSCPRTGFDIDVASTVKQKIAQDGLQSLGKAAKTQ